MLRIVNTCYFSAAAAVGCSKKSNFKLWYDGFQKLAIYLCWIRIEFNCIMCLFFSTWYVFLSTWPVKYKSLSSNLIDILETVDIFWIFRPSQLPENIHFLEPISLELPYHLKCNRYGHLNYPSSGGNAVLLLENNVKAIWKVLNHKNRWKKRIGFHSYILVIISELILISDKWSSVSMGISIVIIDSVEIDASYYLSLHPLISYTALVKHLYY